MKEIKLVGGLLVLLLFNACTMKNSTEDKNLRIRPVVDTVGFAHLENQMDKVIARIDSQFKTELQQAAQDPQVTWRTAICPHDDYTYASWLYPAVLKNLKAKTLIIFGVAHKARNFGLEGRIVFDSFDAWDGPYGPVTVSPLRERIIHQLPEDLFLVHDSMQLAEHSVESMIPSLQQQNPDVEIVSILVPYVSQQSMDIISASLVKAIYASMQDEDLSWGNDVALLITTDAVHYGCDDWSGKNYAPFGCNNAGYEKAVAFENEIINNCFTQQLTNEKINRFIGYTVQENDFREYKWTWCGRYSVPLGLKTALQLQQISDAAPLEGTVLGYETSISHPELPVQDLGMGKTAIATERHWVGYAAVGFR